MTVEFMGTFPECTKAADLLSGPAKNALTKFRRKLKNKSYKKALAMQVLTGGLIGGKNTRERRVMRAGFHRAPTAALLPGMNSAIEAVKIYRRKRA